MQGSGGTRPEPTKSARAKPVEIPERLRDHLRPWIDVDAVGSEGLWEWLEVVLPLLPTSRDAPAPVGASGRSDRMRELARDLVDCAGDRARLIADCDLYYRDNVALARRVKALEATLRTGATHPPPADEGAGADDEPIEQVAERYLPRK